MNLHFGGSRTLKSVYQDLITDVVIRCLAYDVGIHVGCATGADAAVIRAMLPFAMHLSVFAQFSESGEGAFSGSDVDAVAAAASKGAQVSYLAGGPLSLPLKARLIRRSIAALENCSMSFFFIDRPFSPGSLNVAAKAAKACQSVFVFPCGFSVPPAKLPGISTKWVETELFGYKCFKFYPGEISLLP